MKIFEIDKLVASIQGYVETKVELVKLDAKEELSSWVAKLTVLFFLVLSTIMALMFFSFGLAVFLNFLLQSSVWGYLIVGFLYSLILALVFSRRDKILSRAKDLMNKND